MKRRAILAPTVAALTLLALLPPTVRAGPHHDLRPRQTVAPWAIRVHDGDTFSVGVTKIRLRGIDTPELGTPQSWMATRRLAELLGLGPVTIVPRAEDVYGRIVADVYVRGHDVARVLRREGFAKPRP